jgi:hypothetical protein
MGGLGSGRRSDREPRRLVERSFVLDVRQVLDAGLVPGTEKEISLWAPLILWPVHALVLIRRVDGFVATMWFDIPVGGGLVHLRVDVPERGSHRRIYLRCPRPDHPADTRALVAKLYWPVGDPGGFGCRRCHRLAYQSQRTRRGESQWMRRVRIAAAQSVAVEQR